MNLGIKRKCAAVAGASAGLGFATAKALTEEGVRVAICSRNAERVNEAALLIGAVPIVADVGNRGGAEAFVDEAYEALGGLDILVANAGGPKPGNHASTPIEDYPQALELSLLSTITMCSRAVPRMQAGGWGRIVAITSIAVRQPIPNLILSNTARAGLTGFLKTLALEVAGDGITVNSLQPGLHLTDRLASLSGGNVEELARDIPTGKLGDPADFGAVAAFLCSEQAKFITGAAIPVEGGAYKALL
jgi:3-oxoacyl-[acyl-carrier protein] reductase